MRRRHINNKAVGSSFAELPFLAMSASALMMVCSDFYWFILAYVTNVHLCAQAARSVSQGPPDKFAKGEPRRRALAILQPYANTGGTIRMGDLTITEKLNDPLPNPAFGGVVSGEATVSTLMYVRPPFSLDCICGKNGLPFLATKTYPFTWVLPPGRNTAH